MSDEASGLLALKNAWQGVVDASADVNGLRASVLELAEGTPLSDLDLDQYHRATLAQANAVMALRGLIEQLRRKREKTAGAL